MQFSQLWGLFYQPLKATSCRGFVFHSVSCSGSGLCLALALVGSGSCKTIGHPLNQKRVQVKLYHSKLSPVFGGLAREPI